MPRHTAPRRAIPYRGYARVARTCEAEKERKREREKEREERGEGEENPALLTLALLLGYLALIREAASNAVARGKGGRGGVMTPLGRHGRDEENRRAEVMVFFRKCTDADVLRENERVPLPRATFAFRTSRQQLRRLSPRFTSAGARARARQNGVSETR